MTDVSANNPAQEPHSEHRSELRPELRNWCEAWRASLQGVLSQVSGQPEAFEISTSPLPAADSDVWYMVVAGGAVHGEMVLRVRAASGADLARKLLGETAVAPAEGSIPEPTAVNLSVEHKEALEELLRQVAGLAATTLGATAGGEVQLHLSASAAPSWSSDAIAWLQTHNQAGAAITLEIQISPALAAELQQKVQAATSPGARAQESEASTPAVTESVSSYRRLMDVGLDVKLRFGMRHMPLRDVLALSAGVVVELENSLHSPVDLLLDGRLIAQGEVVIVDGKYGLRITDVVEPAAGAHV